MNASTASERRHFARIHFAAGGRLEVAGQPWAVQVLDLSLKGALVDVPAAAQFSTGTAGVLTLPLSGQDDAITMSVDVAHVEGRHVGLICRSIDLDSITHLREVLKYNLGDPERVERDLKALSDFAPL